MCITNEKELGAAIKQQQNEIQIEGALAEKVIKIRAVGPVAWLVAYGLIVIAIGIVISTGGSGAPVSAVVAAPAAATLGLPAAISAITIGVSAGQNSLTELRSYKLKKISDNKIVLYK